MCMTMLQVISVNKPNLVLLVSQPRQDEEYTDETDDIKHFMFYLAENLGTNYLVNQPINGIVISKYDTVANAVCMPAPDSITFLR